MPPESESRENGNRRWVLVSGAFLKTGGQDRANFALASYLARRGAHVHLVSHTIDDQLARNRSVNCHRAPRPLRSDLLGEPFLRRAGRQTARSGASASVIVNGGNCDWPDVNWVHYVHAAYDRPLDGGVLRRARMAWAHRHWLAAERNALISARLIIANSERTKRDLERHVGVPRDRIRVVYYGIDAEQFRPATGEERETTRRTLEWPLDRTVALFIGALGDRRKGFDTVLKAWRIMHARRAGRTPMLVVIGSGTLLSQWRQRVRDAGLDDSIVFLGFRNDVPRLVRAADLLVAPTRYEAYGLGVHEAICCGLPAVVSADAGVAERYPLSLQHLLLPDPEQPEDIAVRVEAAIDDREPVAGALAAFSADLRARTWDDMARDIFAAVRDP
jgi:glycosyltransferase involved in cell wall biosynthesis